MKYNDMLFNRVDGERHLVHGNDMAYASWYCGPCLACRTPTCWIYQFLIGPKDETKITGHACSEECAVIFKHHAKLMENRI